MDTVRVEIIPNRELFRDDITGFKIYSADVKDSNVDIEVNNYGNISLKGNNLPDFNLGSVYDLELARNTKDKYKGSYTMIKSHFVKPQSAEDQWKFLKMVVTENQFESISKRYLVDVDKIVDIILEGRFDYSEVNGYGEATYNILKDKIKEDLSVSEALAYFSEYEIGYNTIKRMVAIYGNSERAIEEIERNPYAIIEKDGFGFLKADDLAMRLGIDPESPHRIKSCMIYVLEDINSSGDIWIEKKKLYNKMKKMLKVKKESINGVIEQEHEEVFVWEDRYSTSDSARNELMLSIMIADKVVKEEGLLASKGYNPESFIKDFENEKKIILSEEQKEFLHEIKDTNLLYLVGNAGSGKAQPVDTIIPTPKGDMRMGDIKSGDYIFDRKGKPTKVLDVFPQGKLDTYKVVLSDGRTTYCNDEHLWSYYTSRGNLKTKTLREMIDIGILNEQTDKKTGRVRKSPRFKIPTNEAVLFNNKEDDLKMHPYVLGAFIGDGSLTSNKLTICSNDEFVVEKVSSILNIDYYKSSIHSFNWNFRYETPLEYEGQNNQKIVRKNVLTRDIFPEEFRRLSMNKIIPQEYKLSSRENRLELIRGLFDTDGSISVNGNRYNVSYSTSSNSLAKDIQEVLRSLGMNSTIYEDYREGRSANYEINVLIDNSIKKELFTLPRKLQIAKEAHSKSEYRDYSKISIVSVENTGIKSDMVCFYVDNPEHLYLTNDYIVTHNTFMQKIIISVADSLNLSVSLLSPTGKASRILTEYTGRQAYTIHKKLGYGKSSGEEGESYIDEDIVLVDEASMSDVKLARNLMSKIKKGALIIFIGDDAQIPSVGEGNFLYDCINCNDIPKVKLTKVFRQKESGMLNAITQTRKGKAFLNTHKVGKQRIGNNFEFRHMIKEEIVDNLIDSYSKMFKNGYSFKDISILVPTNIGEVGTVNINNKIQEAVNPQSDIEPKDEFVFGSKSNQRILRVGDYVMNTENMYDASVVNKAEKIDVFNGETGVVIAVNMGNKEVIVDFEGNHVLYAFTEATRKLSHAWAITTYKSQGSQYDVVLAVVDSSATYQLNANLLYTSMSRAREFLGVFGQAATFNKAVRKFANFDRQSFLGEFLEILLFLYQQGEEVEEIDLNEIKNLGSVSNRA